MIFFAAQTMSAWSATNIMYGVTGGFKILLWVRTQTSSFLSSLLVEGNVTPASEVNLNRKVHLLEASLLKLLQQPAFSSHQRYLSPSQYERVLVYGLFDRKFYKQSIHLQSSAKKSNYI